MIVPAVAFVGLLGIAVLNEKPPPKPGDRAPEFSAQLLDGSGSLALVDLRGKPVMLNFWASWCAPCKDEAPMLQRASEKYGDEIAFVGVDIRDAKSDALAFVDGYGLDYPHIRDEDLKIYDDFGLTGQPETFFLDENGVIVEHVNGPLFEDSLTELLDLLAARDG
ncbi:MAG: cytochrome c biosis protein CcmG, thiol:disulfide interchange protein DsbE [Actinomycetota bacterium]|nr:cytochrome c biosis protein CcmG, thiol:disulfide interchange protein DsbE [Actinomycetota bacterium]